MKKSADIVVALGGGKPSGDDGEEEMPASKPGGSDRSGLIDAMRAMKAALDAEDYEAAADAFEAAKQEC